MNEQKRRLHRGLRKQVQIMRRFKVEHVGAGKIKWTCLTCGWSSVDQSPHPNPDKYVAYIMHPDGKGSGGGVCDRCTREERDRRYPLRGKDAGR